MLSIKKAFNSWCLDKRALVSQTPSVVVHYYISLCYSSCHNNFQFCSPFAILPHLLVRQIVFTVNIFPKKNVPKKNVQVIIMYLYEIAYCLMYCKMMGFYSCQNKWQCSKIGVQGGHGTGKTGKTGNLVLNFSRQGKHREFCFDTGKNFETQGKYFLWHREKFRHRENIWLWLLK